MTKIEVENVIRPGIDLPRRCPQVPGHAARVPESPVGQAAGLTVADILTRVTEHLPDDLFPGGAKAGWWAKAVQLDLEAKGLVKRANTSLSACTGPDAGESPATCSGPLTVTSRSVTRPLASE